MNGRYFTGVLEVSGTTGATKSFTIPSEGFLSTGNWNTKAVYYVSANATPTKIHSNGTSYTNVSVSNNVVTLTNTNASYRQVYSFFGIG